MSYSGTNLGDGAIQAAILMNLSKRIHADFYGINLFPKETERRHGIPAFPITGLAVEFYSYHETLFAEDTPPLQQLQRESNGGYRTLDRVKGGVKKIPFLANGLRLVLRWLREAGNIIREIRHLMASYLFLRKMDLLIVCGSGQLFEFVGGPWGQPYALFRWALLAKLTKTKVAVASVGISGSLKTSLSRFFIRTALATACYRSYRDQRTKQLLKTWRFTHRDPCVPDLAFSLDLSCYSLRSSPIDVHKGQTRVVAISPMSWGKPGHWPEPNLVAYNRYVDELADFASWLIRRAYSILLFASSGADRAAVADLKDRLRDRYGQHALSHLVEPSVNRVEDLLNCVSCAEFVVATRFHGVLLSHLLLKPVLAISYDRKIEIHMKDLEQLPYHIDFHRVTTSQLCESFAALEANAAQVRAVISQRINVFRGQLNSQYEQLVRYARTQPE
jgi:polysaccharide pyruvyl transferase WcaK-like protein